MPEIISRKEALALGLDRYFTGRSCIHGHISPRYVKNSHCCYCSVEARRQWRKAQPKKPKRPRLWDTPERKALQRRKWRARHRDEIAEYQRRYCEKRNAAIRALSELGIEIDV